MLTALAFLATPDALAQTKPDPALDQYEKELGKIKLTPKPTSPQLLQGSTWLKLPDPADPGGELKEVGLLWSNATSLTGNATEIWSAEGGLEQLFSQNTWGFEHDISDPCGTYMTRATTEFAPSQWTSMAISYGEVWNPGGALNYNGVNVQRKIYTLDQDGDTVGTLLVERLYHPMTGLVTWWHHWILYEDFVPLEEHGQTFEAHRVFLLLPNLQTYLNNALLVPGDTTYALVGWVTTAAPPACPP